MDIGTVSFERWGKLRSEAPYAPDKYVLYETNSGLGQYGILCEEGFSDRRSSS